MVEDVPRPARGSTVLLVLGVVHGILLLPLAFALYGDSLDEPEAIVLWVMLTFLSLVVGGLAGAVATDRESKVRGRRTDMADGLVLGAAVFTMAHWVPMLAWTPACGVAVALNGDDYILSGAAGVVAWAIVAGIAGGLRFRGWRWRVREGGPWSLGLLEWLLAAMVGLPAGAMAATVIASGGDGRGFGWVVLPLLAGVVMLWAAPQVWCGAAADMVAARRTEHRGEWLWSFLGRLGALFGIVGVGAFLASLFPLWNQGNGQRFGLQIAMVVTVGVSAWLVTRATVGRPTVAG